MVEVTEDNAGVFASRASVDAYLAGENATTPPDYHKDRVRALRHLTAAADLPGHPVVLDFGCGSGMNSRELFSHAKAIVGVDVSPHMMDVASQSLADLPFTGHVGGAAALRDLEGPFDVALAIDVLGYLEDDERETFFAEAARLLRPGGHLIVMYGNELFDMYALNAGTAAFFETHFDAQVSDLLTEGLADQYKTVRRANPLSFGAEIARFGFHEVGQAFSQWHRTPPGLGNRAQSVAAARLAMRDHAFDPNTLPPVDRWKAMFRSSIFASLSRRA